MPVFLWLLLSFAAFAQTPSPVLTYISPEQVVSGSGPSKLLLTGRNFTPQSVVFLNTKPLATTFLSENSLSADLESEDTVTPGVVQINVINGAGAAEPSNTFFFAIKNGPPRITSLTPSSGFNAGGTLVTITGANFQSPAIVSFGGRSAASVQVINSTTILAATPVSSAGSVSVQVTNPDGNSATLADAFNYVVPLAVTVGQLSNAETDSNYLFPFTAIGGSGPYLWSLKAGVLPSGLGLSSNGVLSGLPTQGGTFNFQVQVSDSAIPAQTAVRSLSLTVLSPLHIAAVPLRPAALNAPYSVTISTSGGTPPLRWSIISGSLPPGMAISAALGEVSGSAYVAGTYRFTLRATDSALPAQSATQDYLITVAEPLQFGVVSLATGEVGASYSNLIPVTGGMGPFAWTVDSGVLPPGVSLSPETGLLSGRPSTAGSYAFTVRVADATQGGQSKTANLNLEILPSRNPAPGQNDVIVFQDDFESGGLEKWDRVPPDFSIEAEPTRVISGQYSLKETIAPDQIVDGLAKWYMPGYDELYLKFRVRFEEGFIDSGSRLVEMIANRIDDQFSSAGKSGVRPNGADYFLSALSPEYPALNGNIPGLYPFLISSYFPEMGCIEGCNGELFQQGSSRTALVPGEWHEVVFRLKANAPGVADGEQTLWIDGVRQIEVTGIRWRDTRDLRLNQIAIPLRMANATQAEAVWFDDITIWSPGATTPPASEDAENPPPDPETPPAGTTDPQPAPGIAVEIANAGFESPLLSEGGWVITTPGWAGVGAAGVMNPPATLFPAEAPEGHNVASMNGGVLEQTLSELVQAGAYYQLSAKFGQRLDQPPASYNLQLATGSTVVTETGILSTAGPGTWATANLSYQPAASSAEVGKPLKVRLVWVSGGQLNIDDVKIIKKTSAVPLGIERRPLPTASLGVAYTQFLAASGGVPPYRWSILPENLPPGLALSSGGQLSGTPTSGGSFNLPVTVSDSSLPPQESSGTFLVEVSTVAAPLSITSVSLPVAVQGAPYKTTLAAVGGNPPYKWSLAGALPVGLSLDPFSGAITGTPLATGSYGFMANVQDSSPIPQFATQVLSASVAAPAAGMGSTGGIIYQDPAPAPNPNDTPGGTGGGPATSVPTPGAEDNIIFEDDFENGSLTKWDEAAPRYGIEADTRHARGRYSASVTINPGYNIGQLNKWYMPGIDEEYVKFQVMFSGGFLDPGMHLAQILGNNISSPWSGSGRAGTRPNGTDYFSLGIDPEWPGQNGNVTGLYPLQFYSYRPDMSCPADYDPIRNQDCYGALTTQTFPKVINTADSWHEVTVHVKLNTPGQSNGVQEMWIDGTQVITQSGIRWRDTDSVRLNQLNFSAYLTNAPKTEYIYIDDVVIWQPGVGGGQAGSGLQSLAINTAVLPSGSVGVNYATTLRPAGGTGTYTWGIDSGALPSGLTLSATTGTISGVPIATGTYNIIFKVSDSSSPVQTVTRAISLVVAANLPSIGTGSLGPATSGNSYSASLAASGGLLPYSWSLSEGALPSGLDLNSLTGAISGTPTIPGNYGFSVAVMDDLGQRTSRNLMLTISSPAAIGAPFFSENFDSCFLGTTRQGGSFLDFGNVSMSDIQSGGKANSLNCSVRSGNSPSLISWHSPMQELWGRERVYLSDGWVKPAGGAAHFWRFWRDINPGSSASWEMIVDQIDGGDNLAIGFMPQAGTSYAGGHGEYWLPISISLSANRGRWMCWEVHLKMNTPGQSDGVAEFYLDGQRLLNATGLNQIGNGTTPGSDNRFQHVNWMSNVGGNSNLWPGETNYWYVDDLSLGTERVGCQ